MLKILFRYDLTSTRDWTRKKSFFSATKFPTNYLEHKATCWLGAFRESRASLDWTGEDDRICKQATPGQISMQSFRYRFSDFLLNLFLLYDALDDKCFAFSMVYHEDEATVQTDVLSWIRFGNYQLHCIQNITILSPSFNYYLSFCCHSLFVSNHIHFPIFQFL